MIRAFIRAVGQLGDPRIRKLVLISLAATVVIYAVLFAVLWWVLFSTEVLTGLPGWETALDWLGAVAVPILALLLFPAVVSLSLGALLDGVVDAVEDRHYPTLPPAREQPVAEVVLTTVRFAAVAVAVNLLALPFYIIGIFVGGVGLVVFYAVNGYLLSREYFELVAVRRMDSRSARNLYKSNIGSLWLAGALTALLLTIPFVNIVAPVVGVAAMVHIVNRLIMRHTTA